jgi:hypothetical protein
LQKSTCVIFMSISLFFTSIPQGVSLCFIQLTPLCVLLNNCIFSYIDSCDKIKIVVFVPLYALFYVIRYIIVQLYYNCKHKYYKYTIL